MDGTKDESGAAPGGGSTGPVAPNLKATKALEMPDDLYSLMQQEQAATGLLGRVVIAGAHSSAERCLEYVGDLRRSSLTGVHLVQRGASLTVLEGPSEDVRAALLSFFSDVQQGTSPWTDVGVAGLSDDVAGRQFEAWTQKQLSVPKEAHLEQPEDDIVGFAAELFVNAVALGPALVEHGGVDAAKTNKPQLFASSERILAVATTNGVMKLADYEGIYGRPVESTSVRDQVWPMHDITTDLQLFH